MSRPHVAGLRRRMRDRAPMTAMFVNFASPELVELCAHAGLDFIVIDAEHGTLAPGDIAAMIRAADTCFLPAMVRVATTAGGQVGHALDAGAAGILAPAIGTAAAARELLALTHYPPMGRRSAAHYVRALGYSSSFGSDSFAELDGNVVTGVVIETPDGVANAAEIMAVPGIDVVFPGKIDLALRQPASQGRLIDVEPQLDALAGIARDCGISIAAAVADPTMAAVSVAAGNNILFNAIAPLGLRALTGFSHICAAALRRDG